MAAAHTFLQRVPDVGALRDEVRARLGVAPDRVDYSSNLLTLSFAAALTDAQAALLPQVVSEAESIAAAAAARSAALATAAEAEALAPGGGGAADPLHAAVGPAVVSRDEFTLVHAWEHPGAALLPLSRMRVRSQVFGTGPGVGYDLRCYDATNNRVLGGASFANAGWSNCDLPLAAGDDGPAFLELHARCRARGQAATVAGVTVFFR